jgi:hypothetical protein
MTPPSYHDTFDKQIGNVRVLSYGGGWPRWVRIFRTDRDDMSIQNLTMEEARDLHYALGRLLELAA